MPDLAVSTLSMAKWEGAGISIDAHPGSEGNEAGVVNRAFRKARVLIGAVGTQEDDLAAVVTGHCDRPPFGNSPTWAWREASSIVCS